MLTFDSPPDFEDADAGQLEHVEQTTGSNTYRVVVQASDGGDGSFVNWFKVTVNVTDVEEPGTLAEWTVNADGDASRHGSDYLTMLLQFQPEAILTVVATRPILTAE